MFVSHTNVALPHTFIHTLLLACRRQSDHDRVSKVADWYKLSAYCVTHWDSVIVNGLAISVRGHQRTWSIGVRDVDRLASVPVEITMARKAPS